MKIGYLAVFFAVFASASIAAPERSPESQRVGQENHPRILARFGGAVQDGALTDYVTTLGMQLVALSEQPDAPWQFTVLDSAQVNAFALPGGYVYVTRGLLALAGDEAELAAVLAHEIVHVTEDHVTQRGENAQIDPETVITGVLGELLGGVLRGDENPLGDAVRGTLQNVIGANSEFSREQEFQADALSIPLLVAAGFDPMGAPDFLTAMRGQYALIAALAGRSYNPAQVPFFADHPAPDDRIARAGELAGAYQFQVAPARGADRYLAAIDGMVFGDSLQQGLVRGRAFLHPVMGFAFSVPQGFVIQNTARAIRTAGPNGALLVMDGARIQASDQTSDQGIDLGRYITQQWIPSLQGPGVMRPRVGRVRALLINGLPAAQVTVMRRVRGQNQTLTLTAVRLNDQIFRFTASTPRGGDEQQRAMQRAVETFGALDETSASVLRPYILQRYRIRRGDTIASLTSAAPQDENAPAWFALLNGLAPGELPPRGTWVKRIDYAAQ